MSKLPEMADISIPAMVPVSEAVAPVTTVFPEYVQEMNKINQEEGLIINPADIVSSGISTVIAFGCTVAIMKASRSLDISSMEMIKESNDYRVAGLINVSMTAMRGMIGTVKAFSDRRDRRSDRRQHYLAEKFGQI